MGPFWSSVEFHIRLVGMSILDGYLFSIRQMKNTYEKICSICIKIEDCIMIFIYEIDETFL